MAKKIDYAAMFTLRKDGRYQGSYTDNTGRHYVYDRDPEKLYNKIQSAQIEKPLLFQDAMEKWQQDHWERIGFSTAASYTAPCRMLSEHFHNRELKDVKASDINAYLANMARQGYSRRSVKMRRDILNMMFNFMIFSGETDSNPCVSVSMPRNLPTQKRTLPPDEALQAITENTEHPFSLFAIICLYAGLRRGEALALQYENIDRKNRVIHVVHSVEFIGNKPNIKDPKTECGIRDVVLLEKLEKMIPKGKGYIFCNKDGSLLSKSQYGAAWKSYVESIGYHITAHQLRHGFATILYEAGIPDKDAQELMGHSNISITRDVYTHIRKSRKAEVADQLNTFLQKK